MVSGFKGESHFYTLKIPQNLPPSTSSPSSHHHLDLHRVSSRLRRLLFVTSVVYDTLNIIFTSKVPSVPLLLHSSRRTCASSTINHQLPRRLNSTLLRFLQLTTQVSSRIVRLDTRRNGAACSFRQFATTELDHRSQKRMSGLPCWWDYSTRTPPEC